MEEPNLSHIHRWNKNLRTDELRNRRESDRGEREG
jgi:hypothetical protein